jgi:hypothetical protein
VATESDLRDLLRGPDPEGRTAIDLDAVLRRARARRRPRVIAASTVGAFALVGVLTPVVLVSQQQAKQESFSVAEDSAGGTAEAPSADDTAFVGMPSAPNLNSCGAPVVDLPSTNGLVLEVTPVSAAAEAASIPIEVTLRNDGTDTMVGVTASQPVVTFSRDGVVLWHTAGIHDSSGVLVDLEPGESMTYVTSFEPLICTPDDEADADADGLREDLPAAGAGSYRLSAAIDFIPDDATAATILVTGPSAPVDLR